jgi:hypothetical protein
MALLLSAEPTKLKRPYPHVPALPSFPRFARGCIIYRACALRDKVTCNVVKQGKYSKLLIGQVRWNNR